jgi:hypothetical protein
MKQDVNEIAALEKTVTEADSNVIELAELQLALVGGGSGEVVLA